MTKRSSNSTPSHSVSEEVTQTNDSIHQVTGKKNPKKLKVRHLSGLTRQIIVEQFAKVLDTDEVADSMDMPGVTGKTVFNVLFAELLPTRKPPARDMSVNQMRRSA